MEPNGWPLDPKAIATIVIEAIDDIDTRDDEQRYALLDALLCAAWPTHLAQDA